MIAPRQLLTENWQLASSAPSEISTPEALERATLQWMPAQVPGTVAQSLGLTVDDEAALDARDWWYRCRFRAPGAPDGTPRRLVFEGLATVCEAWLNGERLLSERNMFVAHSRDVTPLLRNGADNDLVLVFRSLDAELAQKRPRPRWKTALVGHQNLRWARTTLLGRIPGWTPPIAPVGPWLPVVLETLTGPRVDDISLQAWARGTTGHVRFSAKLELPAGQVLRSATLLVGEARLELALAGATLTGTFELPEVPLWHPRTHGEPKLVAAALELETSAGGHSIALGRLGFRSIEVDRAGGELRLRVNGVPVFCRGACWTTNDLVTLVGDEAALRRKLELAASGGANMLRVGGTMVYESEAFYRICDELGILVWQDFMFANMDYPVADESFRAEIEREATYQLKRLSRHPSVAVYCGGSEVQQQAAMLGLLASEWSNNFFDESLPRLRAELHGETAYFASTPCEGALPFHVGTGLGHYYGVGAYRRPLSDARVAQVKFSPECLGFSNVPERETVEKLGLGAFPAPHHPRWKARVPRDSGAGWDFEDVRDHYLRELFGVDPVALRSRDLPRYFELSRALTGEVLKSVYSEWRRPRSSCGGGLVWFFNDLAPGAGWGLIDSRGRPKPVWHALKRAWAPQAVRLTDEGLDGLGVHVINDSGEGLRAAVLLELFAHQRVRTAAPERVIEVPARGGATLGSDELVGYFTDLNSVYRFGPAKYDVIRASARCADTGRLIGEDYFFPQGHGLPAHEGEGVELTVAPLGGGAYALTLRTKQFLQHLALSARGYEPDDNYFHLAPQTEKTVRFTPTGETVAFKAELSALNLRNTLVAR